MKKLRILLIVAVVVGMVFAMIPPAVYQDLFSLISSELESGTTESEPPTTTLETEPSIGETTDTSTDTTKESETTPDRPTTTEPLPTDPITTDPVTEPVTTEPVTTEPVTTEPVTEPITTEPVTEPVVTEPPITEPSTTETPPEPPEIFDLPDPLPIPDAPQALAEALAASSANKLFVYNLSTDTMLANKVGDREIVPASITKLLTILYALSVMPPETVIIPGKELSLVGYNSSVAHIQENVPITLETLIQALLIPSGNDAAYAIAAGVARYTTKNPNLGAREAVNLFMKNAHEYAASLGCTGTHYTCPDGLAWENHYTTAHDMILFVREALKQSIVLKYCKTPSATVTFTNGVTRRWFTSNRLIDPKSDSYSPYVIGLKTGSLTDNYSICAVAEIGGQRFLIGLFRAPTTEDRYADVHRVLDALLSLYGN